jgi:hypothetical protein
VLLVAAVAGCGGTPADGVFARNDDAVTYLVRWRLGAEGRRSISPRSFDSILGRPAWLTRATGSNIVYLDLVGRDPCSTLDVAYVQGSPWLVPITGGRFSTPSAGAPASADPLPSSDECIP